MTKTIVGFMLVDAPHSALNNAGSDAGERTENIVRVKAIRKGREIYPYVSGQALRFWWRATLAEKYGWKLSPIVREAKVAFTNANPVEYDDDDIFGYMRALKKAEGGTVTRNSVLKNSPLISVIGQMPTNDFGVMARQEGDPVPYEHEFYSTVLKGIFSIDIDCAGVFYSIEKTGFKNMYPLLEETAQKNGATKEDDKWVMPEGIRQKRVKDVIAALPYLNGGAKQTSHLTDVSPKFLVLAAINCGNHIFTNIAKEKNGNAEINLDALEEVFNDYSDNLLTDVYIGRRKGFMDEYDSDIKQFIEKHDGNGKKFIYGSINEIVDSFVQKIPELMG